MNSNVMDEPIETIHLYVVREEEKKPFVFLPVCAAVLCLACIVGLIAYSALHPTYEHETLSIPPCTLLTAANIYGYAGNHSYRHTNLPSYHRTRHTDLDQWLSRHRAVTTRDDLYEQVWD